MWYHIHVAKNFGGLKFLWIKKYEVFRDEIFVVYIACAHILPCVVTHFVDECKIHKKLGHKIYHYTVLNMLKNTNFLGWWGVLIWRFEGWTPSLADVTCMCTIINRSRAEKMFFYSTNYPSHLVYSYWKTIGSSTGLLRRGVLRAIGLSSISRCELVFLKLASLCEGSWSRDRSLAALCNFLCLWALFFIKFVVSWLLKFLN